MKLFQFIGHHGFPSKCGLEIRRKPSGTFLVIMSELEDNPGTSITNASESLATQIYYSFLAGVPPEQIEWMERYPAQKRRKTSYDWVSFEWNGKEFRNPKWRHALRVK